MTNARPLMISGAVVVAMSALARWAVDRVGDRRLPMHFGLNGPDNYQPAAVALWSFPVIALGVTLFFAVMPAVMPRTGRLERSQSAYQAVWLGVLMVLAITQAAIVAAAVGATSDSERIVFAGVGALLIVLGNLMGKIRYNYVFGVRTPWTLADERVWDKTHRFMGPWFMAWGPCVLAVAVFAPGGGVWLRYAMLGGAGVTLGLSLAYSYLAARRAGAA
ncbi:SdpI family protein [soil metagenome]